MPDSALALDGKRREFPRLMEQAELVQIRRIVIAQPGRFETFCARHHTEIVVTARESMSPEQELLQDLIAIMTVFASRLLGLRPYTKVIRDEAL